MEKIKKIDWEIGEKVTYVTDYGKKEHGIIKSHAQNPDCLFVVYNCAGEWDKYYNYTAALTNKSFLRKGWI